MSIKDSGARLKAIASGINLAQVIGALLVGIVGVLGGAVGSGYALAEKEQQVRAEIREIKGRAAQCQVEVAALKQREAATAKVIGEISVTLGKLDTHIGWIREQMERRDRRR